jgi:trypsin
VTKFVINQNYDDLYVLNDVALLFLDSPVMGVTPIILNTDPDIPSDGEILEAIGFGATDGNLTKIPVKLLQVDLPKVNDDTCENLWTVNVDTKTQICAGGRPEGGKSTCGGDSGMNNALIMRLLFQLALLVWQLTLMLG